MSNTVINPHTGRRIKVGGRTHRKLHRQWQIGGAGQDAGAGTGDAIGKTVQDLKLSTDNYYTGLLEKAKGTVVPPNTNTLSTTRSKYALIPSTMPPSPETHSWYHHHAPLYQTFGNYVCVDKTVLQQLGSLLHDTMG